MSVSYRIHPAIGIARVGDAKDDFYLAPETGGSLPLACDNQGNQEFDKEGKPIFVREFKKDRQVKRQAARFKMFVYDSKNPEGRELKKGDHIQGVGSSGELLFIEWTVYLANKKSSWYQFQQLEGEYGYSPDHPLRNKEVPENARQKLIIDPGAQTINYIYTENKHDQKIKERREAHFERGKNPNYAQIFPPKLEPYDINTLGEIKTDDLGNLIVLGGYGRSGSYKKEFGQPNIIAYANNPGWFDDISDGPVYARLAYWDSVDDQIRYVPAESTSWAVVGYPSYAPQIEDMVTIDDILYDLNVRNFATNTYLYGTGPFDKRQVVAPDQLENWRNERSLCYNPNYYPYFYKEIWPILVRPFRMQWVTSVLAQSNFPHDTGSQGNFDEAKLSQPPKDGKDPFREMRNYIWMALRKHGDDNVFTNETDPESKIYKHALMPLLCGDNPISNTLPAKFLTLTETQLFLIKQWALGKFINEKQESISDSQVEIESPGEALDRGVLANMLGGAFCPGGEVTWFIRNVNIYESPYRIRPNPATIPNMDASSAGTTMGAEIYNPNGLSLTENIAEGLEPGDITKRMAVPWQSDFNECTDQPINVTYQQWNQLYPNSIGDTAEAAGQKINLTLWWPTHRPMQVFTEQGVQVDWARGIPATYAGNLKMVSAWKDLGFVINNPDTSAFNKYIEIDRNAEELGEDP